MRARRLDQNPWSLRYQAIFFPIQKRKMLFFLMENLRFQNFCNCRFPTNWIWASKVPKRRVSLQVFPFPASETRRSRRTPFSYHAAPLNKVFYNKERKKRKRNGLSNLSWKMYFYYFWNCMFDVFCLVFLHVSPLKKPSKLRAANFLVSVPFGPCCPCLDPWIDPGCPGDTAANQCDDLGGYVDFPVISRVKSRWKMVKICENYAKSRICRKIKFILPSVSSITSLPRSISVSGLVPWPTSTTGTISVSGLVPRPTSTSGLVPRPTSTPRLVPGTISTTGSVSRPVSPTWAFTRFPSILISKPLRMDGCTANQTTIAIIRTRVQM